MEPFKQHERDTGSPEVQVALITKRINSIVEHLKANKKDHNTRRGLLLLVGQRKQLLKYLEGKSRSRYEDLIKKLKLREKSQ